MNFLTTLNTFKSSNFYMKFSNDLSDITAVSYDWWQFCHRDKAGNILFNDVSYSVSTRKHQSSASNLLRRYGLRISISLGRTKAQLDNPENAINQEIKCLRSDILDLIKQNKTPRTWKKTKEKNRNKISSILLRIKDLRNFRDNYLDKKLWSVKRYRSQDYKAQFKDILSQLKNGKTWENFYVQPCQWHKDLINIFTNKQGKLMENELFKFINQIDYSMTSYRCENVLNLFGIKSILENTDILKYRFLSDLNAMIPDENSEEMQALLKYLKRAKITKENLNQLQLDKIHEYFIKLQNKSHEIKTIKEPLKFPLNETLNKLIGKNEDLKIIENDRQLRAEGKKQRHCIGSEHYIKKCLLGYNALNFKGYTFFLDSENKTIETHGKCNSYTPENIRLELETILKAA